MDIFIPEDFYSQQEVEGDSYSKTPTGRIAPQRLINQDPAYWVAGLPIMQKKPKTLILSDWSLDFDSYKTVEKKAIIEALLNMQPQPFEIKIWQDGALLPLTKENINLYFYDASKLKKITPTTKEQIEAVLKKSGNDLENIVYLDAYTLKQLTSKEPINPFIQLSSFNRRKAKTIKEWASSFYPQTIELIIDERLEDTLSNLEIPTLQSEYFKRKTVIKKLWIDQANLEALLDHQTVQIGNDRFSYNQLRDLEAFELWQVGINLQDIKNAFNLLPKIKSIKLDNQEIYSQKSFNEDGINLPSLIHLDLNQLEMRFDDLIDLFERAPNLKFLENFGGMDNAELSDTSEASFPALEIIKFRGDKVNAKNFTQLVKLAPNIKVIELSNCIEFNFKYDGKLTHYLNLEKRCIEKLARARKNDPKEFESHEKNLHKLRRAISELREWRFLKTPPNSLPSLDILKLDSSNINIQNLGILLKAAPNIKSILFYESKKLDKGHLKLEPNSLASLESINLHASNISLENLSMLLKAAPYLKSIVFYESKNLDKARLELEPNSLASLKSIDLHASNISLENFNTILKAAPNLKSIDLSYSRNIDEGHLELESNSLASSEHINLNRSNISLENVLTLLKAAPNLKSIDLNYCKSIDKGQLELEPNSLASLESIDLQSSNISLENILTLLRAAPNLIQVKMAFRRYSILKNAEFRAYWHLFEEEEKKYSYKGKNHSTTYDSMPTLTESEQSDLRTHNTSTNRSAIDADTKYNPNKTLDIDRNIYALNATHPHPSKYRNAVYQQLIIEPEITAFKPPFQLSNSKDLQLESCPHLIDAKGVDLVTVGRALTQSHLHQNKSFFIGNKNIILTSNWQALPGLTANDDFSHVSLDKNIDYEIKYSKRDQLYYIRSKDSASLPVNIRYLFSNSHNEIKIPSDIQSLIEEIKRYGSNALKIRKEKPSGEDYLEALITQKQGACRHRAVAFKALMARQFPNIATRIVTNDCHAYVEIKLDDAWLTCDLGGHSATLNITEQKDTLNALAKTDLNVGYSERPESNTGATESSASNAAAESISSTERSSDIDEISSTQQEASLTETQLLTLSFAYQSLFSSNHAIQSLSKNAWHTSLLNNSYTNTLIQTTDEQSQQEVLLALYEKAKHAAQPVFLIEKVEDLFCAQPRIEKLADGTGKINTSLGGEFYDFLTKTHTNETQPIILINYANFKPQDIIRFNNLLDDTKQVDGIQVGAQFKIIGVQDLSQPKCYRGADFSSRFHQKLNYPFPPTPKKLKPEMSDGVNAEVDDESTVQTYQIDLYHGKDWREQLLGRWRFSASGLQWVEGKLIQAIKSKSPIEILNGPENNQDYQFFWQRLAIDKNISGLDVDIDIDIDTIQHRDFYDWPNLVNGVNFFTAPPESFLSDKTDLLNQQSLARLITDYQVNNTQQSLIEIDGKLLEASKQTTKNLSLLLTESLTKDQWAFLLSKANDLNVTLDIKLLPNTLLPSEIATALSSETQAEIESASAVDLQFDISSASNFIYSSDSDVTLIQLLSHQTTLKPQVIDISALDPQALLIKLQANFDKQRQEFYFNEQVQNFLQTLQDKDSKPTFILKGQFSQELLSALLPYIQQYPNQITLVTEDKAAFMPFGMQHHEVSLAEKLAALASQSVDASQLLKSKFNQSNLAKLPYSKLQTLYRHQLTHPENTDIYAPWQGFYQLKSAPLISDFNSETAERDTREFITERFKLIHDALQHQPYVFIGGLTGVGKSTFIEKHIAPDKTVYFDEKSLAAWAKNPNGGYLFIDEANIAQRDWSEFEGLFATPPTMLIDGKPTTLGANHKVIFAGNPLNYGGSRHQASLFERHGNGVLFQPLPANVIYQQILLPIFENTALTEQRDEISAEILKAYNFLVSKSQDKILVTPRQLKSIAMLSISDFAKHPEKDINEIVQAHILQVLTPLVPQQNLTEFKRLFPDLSSEETTPYSQLGEDYLVTPSRQKTYKLLNDFLTLRAFKQVTNELNETQLYGDLCSLTLESQPGLGKSQFIHALMQEHKIAEGDIHSNDPQANVYYFVPVTLSFEEKERLLRKAFNEGNIIMMDEINSSPMMERLVNSLLMGKTPEGNFPNKPGFLLLGTQNPISMGARQAQTEAQNKRMVKVELKDYPAQEMVEILKRQHQLPELHAKALVHAFREKQQQSTPPLTFRTLLNMAKELSPQFYNDKTEKHETPIATRRSSFSEQRIWDRIYSLIDSGDDITDDFNELCQQICKSKSTALDFFSGAQGSPEQSQSVKAFIKHCLENDKLLTALEIKETLTTSEKTAAIKAKILGAYELEPDKDLTRTTSNRNLP